MDETRKCWIERQSAGAWAASIADSLQGKSMASVGARQQFSKSLCDFLLQHLFMGDAPPNALLLSFLNQALASRLIEPAYFFSLNKLNDPSKPRSFKVYIQQLYLFLGHLSAVDKVEADLPALLLRICAMLAACVALQFDRDAHLQQNGIHQSSQASSADDYCRLWDSALSHTEQQRDADVKKENAAMAAKLLASLLTTPSSLAIILVGKCTGASSSEWQSFESGMRKLHSVAVSGRRSTPLLAASTNSNNDVPVYLHALVSCFANVMWPLTLQSTLRSNLQENVGLRSVLLLADGLAIEHPQQPSLEYVIQWEIQANELHSDGVWRFVQAFQISGRPWRVFCCRMLAAVFNVVNSAVNPSMLLRARLFLLVRLPQLLLSWSNNTAYDSFTKRNFLELTGDTSDSYSTLELAFAYTSAFPSIYMKTGSNLLEEAIQSFAQHGLINLDHMRTLLSRDIAAVPSSTAFSLDDRITNVESARALLDALLNQKDTDWGRQGRIATALVNSVVHLTNPHPLVDAILRNRESVCATLNAHQQLAPMIVQLFHICHYNAESVAVLADTLALLLYIFVKYDLRASENNQATVQAALERDRTAPPPASVSAPEQADTKQDSKRRKTAGGRSKVEELAPPVSAGTVVHTPLPANAPVLRWYRAWLTNTASIGAAVEGDAQQAAEVLLAELLGPVRNAPAKRDGWRTLAACECVTERVLQSLVGGRLDWNSSFQALTALVNEHPHVIPSVGKWLADHQRTFPAAQNSPHPEISATAAVGLELFGPQATAPSAMLEIVRELRLLDFTLAQNAQPHTIPSLTREPLATTVRNALLALLHHGLRTDLLQKITRTAQRATPEHFAYVLLQELQILNSTESAAATGTAAQIHIAELAACLLATVGGASAVRFALTSGLALTTVALTSLASCQQLAYFYATLVACVADVSLSPTQSSLQPLWNSLASIVDNSLNHPSVLLSFAVTLIALLQRLPQTCRAAPLRQLAMHLQKLGLEEMALMQFDLSHAESRASCRSFFVHSQEFAY